jgi:hypothetical protein
MECIEIQVKVYLYLAKEWNPKMTIGDKYTWLQRCKLCMKGQKYFIFTKIRYMDLCASILQFHHRHLIARELNPMRISVVVRIARLHL